VWKQLLGQTLTLDDIFDIDERFRASWLAASAADSRQECVAVCCCSVWLHGFAVLQSVNAVCCSFVVCCSCVRRCWRPLLLTAGKSALQCVVAVLQCVVAVCCSVAVCCASARRGVQARV